MTLPTAPLRRRSLAARALGCGSRRLRQRPPAGAAPSTRASSFNPLGPLPAPAERCRCRRCQSGRPEGEPWAWRLLSVSTPVRSSRPSSRRRWAACPPRLAGRPRWAARRPRLAVVRLRLGSTVATWLGRFLRWKHGQLAVLAQRLAMVLKRCYLASTRAGHDGYRACWSTCEVWPRSTSRPSRGTWWISGSAGSRRCRRAPPHLHHLAARARTSLLGVGRPPMTSGWVATTGTPALLTGGARTVATTHSVCATAGAIVAASSSARSAATRPCEPPVRTAHRAAWPSARTAAAWAGGPPASIAANVAWRRARTAVFCRRGPPASLARAAGGRWPPRHAAPAAASGRRSPFTACAMRAARSLTMQSQMSSAPLALALGCSWVSTARCAAASRGRPARRQRSTARRRAEASWAQGRRRVRTPNGRRSMRSRRAGRPLHPLLERAASTCHRGAGRSRTEGACSSRTEGSGPQPHLSTGSQARGTARCEA